MWKTEITMKDLDPARTEPDRILAAVSDEGFSPRIRND
jgi:hypothetical protein